MTPIVFDSTCLRFNPWAPTGRRYWFGTFRLCSVAPCFFFLLVGITYFDPVWLPFSRRPHFFQRRTCFTVSCNLSFFVSDFSLSLQDLHTNCPCLGVLTILRPFLVSPRTLSLFWGPLPLLVTFPCPRHLKVPIFNSWGATSRFPCQQVLYMSLFSVLFSSCLSFLFFVCEGYFDVTSPYFSVLSYVRFVFSLLYLPPFPPLRLCFSLLFLKGKNPLGPKVLLTFPSCCELQTAWFRWCLHFPQKVFDSGCPRKPFFFFPLILLNPFCVQWSYRPPPSICTSDPQQGFFTEFSQW